MFYNSFMYCMNYTENLDQENIALRKRALVL